MWFFENVYEKILANPWACAADIVLTALLIYGVFVFLQKNNAKRLLLFILVFTALGVILASPHLQLTVIGSILK